MQCHESPVHHIHNMRAQVKKHKPEFYEDEVFNHKVDRWGSHSLASVQNMDGDDWDVEEAPSHMQHEYIAQAEDLRMEAKKKVDVSSESVKELKKLNKHMGAIEGKVSELHKQYNELKEQTGAKLLETPALADIKDPTTT